MNLLSPVLLEATASEVGFTPLAFHRIALASGKAFAAQVFRLQAEDGNSA